MSTVWNRLHSDWVVTFKARAGPGRARVHEECPTTSYHNSCFQKKVAVNDSWDTLCQVDHCTLLAWRLFQFHCLEPESPFHCLHCRELAVKVKVHLLPSLCHLEKVLHIMTRTLDQTYVSAYDMRLLRTYYRVRTYQRPGINWLSKRSTTHSSVDSIHTLDGFYMIVIRTINLRWLLAELVRFYLFLSSIRNVTCWTYLGT